MRVPEIRTLVFTLARQALYPLRELSLPVLIRVKTDSRGHRALPENGELRGEGGVVGKETRGKQSEFRTKLGGQRTT